MRIWSRGIKFWLAKWFGTPHFDTDLTEDGTIEHSFEGYVWRGTFYVWKHRTKILDPDKLFKKIWAEETGQQL